MPSFYKHKMNVFYKHWLFIITALSANQYLQAQTDTSTVLEEVTVTTGQYTPQSLKKSVYKIKVITAEQIKARAALNLAQVLNMEPGIRFSNDNTLGVSDIQLMGMTGRSIKILLDGVPVADRNDTRESLNQIDIQTIERVEIVEGPMSVIYGSDALAGVINIITKKNNNNRFSVGVRVQEETAGDEYSFWGNKGLHLQSLNASFSKNKFFTNGGFTHNDFRGYGGNSGRGKSWKPKEQWLGNIIIGHRGAKNTIYYRVDGLDENIAAKGAINMDTYKAFDQQFITRRWMHQVQDDWQINRKFHLNSAVSYTDYSRRTRSTRHDFTNNTDELTAGLGEQDTAVFTTLFFRSQGHYMINEKLSLQPGIEYNRNAASGARIEGSPVINDFAFFASAEWKPVERINIRPGFRIIKNSLYDAPPVVPALNVKIGLRNNIDLRLSYAQGYRAPALRELYFDFIDANHSILGNKDLVAETSNSVNAALSWRYGTELRSTFTLSSFYNAFDNLIDYGVDANDASITRMMNVNKFKTTGVSFEQIFVYKQWQLNFGALYIGRYNRLSNEDNVSREVPQLSWSPEANASLYYNWAKAKATLALMYKYTGPRPSWQFVNGTSSNEVKLTELGSFNWADFTATKTLLNHISLQAGVKNIFDIKNVNNTSSGNGAHSTGGPAPIGYGRSYFLGISYQFIKNK